MKNIVVVIIMSLIIYLTNGQTQSKNTIFYYSKNGAVETNQYKRVNIEFDYRKQYFNLKNVSVKDELVISINHKDYRFIAISGVGELFPGLDGYTKDKDGHKAFGVLPEYEQYLQKFSYKIIEGTSDAISSDLPPLQSVAYDFAKKYNQLLLKNIRQMRQ